LSKFALEETPFFLLSRAQIAQNFRRFKAAFPTGTIYYAIKANSEMPVLLTLLNEGSSFEAASKYELDTLAAISVPAERIAYGSAVKPAAHIREFFEYGVRLYAFDSDSELEKLASEAPGSSVYLRLSIDDSASVFRFSEKFGADRGQAVSLFLHAKALGLNPCGISFHVGSQSTEAKAWAGAIREIVPSAEALREIGMPLALINIGGGFPIQYEGLPRTPTVEDIAQHIYSEFPDLNVAPALALEPGRGIAASAAVLVSKVIARVERRGRTWLFMDVGVYNGLFESMAYQGSTRYRVTLLHPKSGIPDSLFSLAGPTGDSPDVIARDVCLPSNVDTGDKLVFHDVGAYSIVCASQFNGFPHPNIFVI
jgi:ornithine decarboxylase